MGENIQNDSLEAVFPTAFFPSLEYIAKAFHREAFVIETQETFQKQSIRNRCVILGPNGLQALTVPVKKPSGSKTITQDIEIDYSTNWIKNHLESIQTAYGNYPYFDHYFSDVVELLHQQHKHLLSLNTAVLDYLSAHLELNYYYSLTENFNFSYSYNLLSYPFINKGLNLTNGSQIWGIPTDQKLSILHYLFAFGPMTRALLIN